MRKTLAIMMMMFAVNSYAAFPEHSNTATVNIDKITGNWDSFNWKWAGYDSQTNSMIIQNNSGGINLTGFIANGKISRYSETGLVTYFAATNMTINNSNIMWTVSYTNIPPNGTYLCEGFLYEGATTNPTRTIWQGKVTVFDSIYGDDDSNYPFTYGTNLIEYLKIVTAQATYVSNIIYGGQSGTGAITRSGADVTITFPESTNANTAIYATTANVASNLTSAGSNAFYLAGTTVAAATNAATVTGSQSGTISTVSGWGDHATNNYAKTNQATLWTASLKVTNTFEVDQSGLVAEFKIRSKTWSILNTSDEDTGFTYSPTTKTISWGGTNDISLAKFLGPFTLNNTNIGATVAAQGVTIGTLQTSNDTSFAWQGSVSNRLVGMITNGGTYSSLTITNFTAAGNVNVQGYAITNVSTLSDPSILTGVSNTITLGGAVNHYYWDLTNNSQVTFAPCASNKGSRARLDVNKSGFALTLNSTNCITNGLGNISICTNVAESGNYSYLIDQGVMGTNVYSRKIGVYQLR